MKKTLLLIPLLMLSGCVNQTEDEYFDEIYTNVYYDYNYEDRYYHISYEEQEWKMRPENLHTIYVVDYKLVDEEKGKYDPYNKVLNEFFVKGNNYKLFVYEQR